ncbi:MAG: tRNA 2-thiocytidine biosynthesis protein TtcA [Clostridia bacterium]|nr:tRNA 2-thiocytidine biosynthesis protein TtcA [Clostridia bacterium]
MARTLSPCERIERSILTDFRKTLWKPFIAAVKHYDMIHPGDRIGVCISGGKDSMLLAKLFQVLHRHTAVPFELEFIVMDPGYNPINRQKIIDNAALMEIPIRIFDSDIFDAATNAERNPCYLCARMRRGFLYDRAQELGCNKIALGHHFNDVIETTVMGMFCGSQLQAMLPKLHSLHFERMELIRPMYMIHEDSIKDWCAANGLTFIQCACRFVEARDHSLDGVGDSKRQEIKMLLRQLKENNPDVEKSIFNSIHTVTLDTFPGWKIHGKSYSYLEDYDQWPDTFAGLTGGKASPPEESSPSLPNEGGSCHV